MTLFASSAGLLADDIKTTLDACWHSSRRASSASIWRAQFDDIGSMTVAGDRLLVGAHRDTGAGKGAELVACLSADTGKILWTVTHDALPDRVHDMAACIASKPFVDGDHVFYVSNRGELCCVALENGHPVWTIDMPQQLGVFKRDPGDIASLAPSPIVVGNAVYCITGRGATQDGPALTSAPSFIAADKKTGKVLWSSKAPGANIAYGQWATPLYVRTSLQDMILFPAGDGRLYSLNPSNGDSFWNIDCHHALPNIVGHSDFITGLPLQDGDTVYASPAVDVECSIHPERIVAIDLHNHTIRWTCLPTNFNGSLGPMAIYQGILCAVGCNGVVVGIDSASGKQLWSRDTGLGRIQGGLLLHDGKLYVGATDGIAIISPRTGEVLDQCDVDAHVATLAISGGRLFAAGEREIRAIRLPGAEAGK